MLFKLKEKLPEIKENEPLVPHTTYKIGGPAKYFFEAKNNSDLIKALRAADQFKLKYFVLGGGSNILFSDNGFDGLVIKQSNDDFEIKGNKIFAESGADVQKVLMATLDAGLIGWSWAGGLPGTIGGAIRGNAGAYGKGMSDITESTELYYQGKVQFFSREQMKFSYRHSIAKIIPCVLIAAVLKLEKGDVIKDRAQVKDYIDYRIRTQPLDCPNVGCIFKNIDLTKIQVDKERIKKKLDITEVEWQKATKYNKLPVSFIFEKMNLKGKTMGGAQVSEKHGAFIINIGKAKAEHVVMLMSDLKMRVRNELGIALEEEIELVGF
ncbi:MAG: UDP-N-acetylenolpyruvoylglucosamine reductase [Candidatus Buchananbacteria bacterium RIFCSPHIGHO2_02_FULL_39_17]|nr:MAG: UDP-N-acetylenolpyruvoylglucosamine reductase [Candidatus Buchananbacteria bacterium RIFCSPHIGHO2_02_FULL_39_17]